MGLRTRIRGWARARARRQLEAREQARYEFLIERVPAGLNLLCGAVVGVDVPQDRVREHVERDCAFCRRISRAPS